MNMKYLRNLDISANGIKDEGMESIVPALIQMDNLDTLDLSRCMVSNEGLMKYLFALRDQYSNGFDLNLLENSFKN